MQFLTEVCFVFPKTSINDDVCTFFQSRSVREKINNKNKSYDATMEERNRMHETQKRNLNKKKTLMFAFENQKYTNSKPETKMWSIDE